MSEEPFRPIRGYKRRRLYPKYEETPQENQENQENIQINQEEIILATSQMTVTDDEGPQKPGIVLEEPKPVVVVQEKIRDPYTALREESNKKIVFPRRKLRDPIKYDEISDEPSSDKPTEPSPTRTPIDLKAILKQAGGISLSELLQQKNLSLSDLLKGEKHAIQALTKMHDQTVETNKNEPKIEEDKPKRYNGYRRIPPSLNKKLNENEEQRINAEEKKITNPFIRKDNRHFTDFKQHEATTESTTERRIFVPSHPKYYTSINFKPDIKEFNYQKSTIDVTSTSTTTEINDDENSVETTTPVITTYAPKLITTNPLRKITLPPTLAKLRNKFAKTTSKPKETETENYPVPFVPEKAIKININELFGFSNIINTPKTTEGPLKISVDIQSLEENSKEDISDETIVTTTENKQINEETIENTSEPEKLKPTSAKEEIDELLSDTMSRENLLNILEARNMTLTELLEQRERGSSQRHLADIFHNQTREPEAKEVVVENNPFLEKNFIPPPIFQINSEFPNFLNSDETNRESRQNQNIRKQTEDYNIINNPLFRTDSKKTNEVINKLIPVWRQAYTNMQKNQDTNNLMHDEIILKDEAQRVEEIENQIAEAVNGALNEVEIRHKIAEEEDNSYLQLPYGVRSAVIASATIVGISLFVFITIFIIFKLSQKKHKRLTYSNSLSSLKIRSPIIESQYQKRIFSQLMNSTLGRKKKVSTISSSEPQSLQDYLWENDRKPFQ